MAEDDVLRQVRAAREAFAAAHGYDTWAMVAALRAMDAAGDWPVVAVAPGGSTAHADTPAAPDQSPQLAGS
ncbi:MAG: hypothetical protein U0871_18705 [Gemmataceae bacterium]